MEKALYAEQEKGKIRCRLCPKYCLLGEGQIGLCGARRVEKGVLYSDNYGCIAAMNIDPVEKKPLFHFYPGEEILSLGTFGCNLHCSFCQNWSLARGKRGICLDAKTPEQILDILEESGGLSSNIGVAYTYNEPLIWYEFVLDTARLLHDEGYKNVLVTNGYINKEPLLRLLPYIDAMNIDLKGYTDHFYHDSCRGSLQPVKDTIILASEHCHTEITCLLIPSLNDDIAEQDLMAQWLGSINPDLPLHYSRYFPQYKLDLPPTPAETMIDIANLARKYLRYVYLGNISLSGSSDTVCPDCGNLLIRREGYRVSVVGLTGTNCSRCAFQIAIIR